VLSGGGEAWFGRLFTLPHTLVGIGATAYWLFLWCWIFFGADLPAVVTGTDVQTSRKSGSSYLVKYEFRAEGEVKQGSSGVSFDDYQRYRAQDNPKPVLTVRHLSFWLFEHTELRSHVRWWNPAGAFTLWIGFWDTAVGAFFYMLWIKPLRIRWLYRHGEATPGRVTNKGTESGKSTRYYVSYVFEHPYTGEQLKGEVEALKRVDYDSTRIGQPVTVLYAPNKVKRNTMYELGGYGVFEANE